MPYRPSSAWHPGGGQRSEPGFLSGNPLWLRVLEKKSCNLNLLIIKLTGLNPRANIKKWHPVNFVMSEPPSSPRGGQIWEVVDGCEAHIQFLFTAPITFSGSGRLTAGERVCIAPETAGPQPGEVDFLPVRYDELHDSLVPLDIRDTPRYKKYLLSVKREYFYEHFRLVEDVV